ncbi:terminase [Pseudomonas phage Bjorn]|uniref:Terminase, large subunit n=1 Tax=Pseudomonas phage Bjorn TaxID=2079288 RepID=A0A2K9VHU0_9CAUD|nr:terminase [Pseudomonas phage Bjorn]AUV61815.1 terminase [Pseudomonas phage Bjorn]
MSDAIQQEKLLAVMQELKERQKFWKMKTFSPYGWQKEFITASSNCFQLLAMTGNRCGKTYTGGYIMACHLTGLYPDWWDGRRYDRPVEAWAAGISTDTTRDILQSELLGKWNDPMKFGTGMIPKELILETVNKPGVPGAYQAVLVKHVSGGVSTLVFKSYEMSQDKFMGTSIDVVWLDEECPKDIFTQCVTRTATQGGIVYLTFTPESGLTELVKDFMYDIKKGQFMVSASWEDAPHLDEAVKEQLMSVYSPAERKMRVSGQPSIGSGVVFPVVEADISVAPFSIPDHWMRIIGIDLGFDHPNAVASIAWDQESDVYYLCDEYSRSGENLGALADAIRAKGGQDIPVVVPHDAFKHDGATTGKRFIDLLQGYGLNIVREPFSNPPGPDGKHGGNSVEFGVNWMLSRMDQGSFRVFSTCTKFLQEMKLYHRKDGKIVDRNDDMISATRYGCIMAARHARPGGLLNTSYYKTDKVLKPSWFSGVY